MKAGQDQFGVSRTVVREALRELSALGIITLKQGKPTTVNAPTTAAPLQSYFKFAVNGRSVGLWEGFELRRSLEVEVVGLAAERAPEEVLSELGDIVERMRESVRDKDRWSRMICVSTCLSPKVPAIGLWSTSSRR